MGKDDSCEPVTKKLKQAQLCFKSPKSANKNLKSKINDSSINDNCNKPSNKSPTKQNEVSKKQTNDSKPKSTSPAVVIDLVLSSNDDIKKDGNKIQKNIDDLIKCDSNSPKNDKVTEIVKPSCKSDSSVNTTTPMEVEDDISPKLDNGDHKSPGSDSAKKRKNMPSIVLALKTDDQDSNNSSAESPVSSKANDSVSLNNESLSSPKSPVSLSSDSDEDDKSSSSTPVTPKTPVTPSMKRQMTPKMLKRHEESLRKKELQEKLKAEKLALKEQTKNERLKQKMDDEEKKKKLKEENKKKRIAELELKNEEKRMKQEDKRQKLEDKRLKKEKEEEEKKKKKELKLEEQRKEEQKKEEEERRKERTQAAFVSFFKKQSQSSPSGSQNPADSSVMSLDNNSPIFMPFPMKGDMRLAVVCRRELADEEKKELDTALSEDASNKTYLDGLKNKNYTPRVAPPTWPPPTSEELHDCIIIEAQVDEGGDEHGKPNALDSKQSKSSHHAKLLQFCENRRPAYYGTWTKSSQDICGRRPFAKDTQGVLDYEVDSDSDWEEEEEGEDLDNVKDDEAEGQEEEVEDGENGYLLDNTFVPHGYLSDEEQPEDEELQESVEKQKDRLVALREEFDEEMKQGGAQALKPRLLGCLWVSNSTTLVSKGSLYEVLLGHRAVWEESAGSIEVEEEQTPENSPSTVQTPPKKTIPPLVMQEIARMVHGSRWPLNRLVREVSEVLSIARPQNPVSRLALTRTIKQMASKTLDSKENSVWSIKPEFREEFKLEDLELTPAQVTPESRVKTKGTILDSFLKGVQSSAKKRISLTPISDKKDNNDVEMDVTPKSNKQTPSSVVPKKKVAFVTLPPRTPKNNPCNTSSTIPRTPTPWTSADGQISIKPHIDTPRPTINKFINKDKTSPSIDTIEISDESNT